MKYTYMIASERSWNAELSKRLMQRTGHQFLSVTSKEALSETCLKTISPKMIFFPHWSYHIPAHVFQSFDSIIFHMTDVPYGRGGSPLQNLIMQGHQDTVISALRCVDELDAGPVYLKSPLSLSGTAEDIFYRADKVIEDMIVTILEMNPVPVEQEGEPVFFKRRKPEEGHLKAANTLSKAFDMIRMLDAEGYPPAFIETEKLKVEFKKVKKQGNQLEAMVIISER